jgi:hypothetical protein
LPQWRFEDLLKLTCGSPDFKVDSPQTARVLEFLTEANEGNEGILGWRRSDVE